MATFNFGTTPAATPSTNIQWGAIQNAAGQNSLINQLYAGKPIAPKSSITSSPSVIAASSAVKNAAAPQNSYAPSLYTQANSSVPYVNPNAGFNNNVASTAASKPASQTSSSAVSPSIAPSASIQPASSGILNTPVQTQTPAPQTSFGGMTTMYDKNGNQVQVGDPTTNTYNEQTNPNGYFLTDPTKNQASVVPSAGQPAQIDASLYGNGLFGSLLQNAIAAQQKSQQFNQSLEQGKQDITKQPIPLDFVQGQQAAIQRDYGVQQQALSQQAQNAVQAAQLASPQLQYGALTSPATGQPISAGGSSSLPQNLPAAAQSALSLLPLQGQQAVMLQAQRVQNNLSTLADANTALSAYGQMGQNALQAILGSGFSVPRNTGAVSAAQQNTAAVGTAPVNAQLGVYQQQLQNLGQSQVAASQIAAFGNQLLNTMSQPPAQGGLGINPYSSQFANEKLNQLKTQFNDPQYAQFNTNIAGLQARVSALLQTGEIPTAATAGAQDIVNGNATLASMQATLNQIAAEAGAITGSQAQVASTAFQQAQQAAGGQNQSNSIVIPGKNGSPSYTFVKNAQGVWVAQ